MRIQPYGVDSIPYQTSNCVSHKDSQQFLNGPRYIWCQIIMISPVTNRVSREINKILPSKLESHYKFEWVEKHTFESFCCSYPNATFGLVSILHDRFVYNHVGRAHQETSNNTRDCFSYEQLRF